MDVVYANGSRDILVPSGQKIAVYSLDPVKISTNVATANKPAMWALLTLTTGGSGYTSSAFTTPTLVKVEPSASLCYYEVGVDPDMDGAITTEGVIVANDIAAATGATTALKLANLCQNASETQEGVAELATAAEIITGTDTGRVPNVANLKTALASDGMWLTKRTKMPDVSGVVYSQDAWLNADGWALNLGGTPSTSGGTLIVPSAGIYKANLATLAAGKYFLAKVTAATAGTLRIYKATAPFIEVSVQAGTSIISAICPISTGAFGISGLAVTIDWIWIGDLDSTTKQLYTAGTLSEEAARIADQLGDLAGIGTKAYSTLTSTGTAPADAATVTVGGKAYTFKTILGTTEGQVLIGDTASAAAALDNLKLAINGDVGTFGVNHYCAAANPLVIATTNTDTTQVVEAIAEGLLGNQITTAESSTQLSWANPDGGTGNLSRGTDAATQKILTSAANYIAGGGTRPAAAKVELTLTTLIGYETTVDVASGATLTLPSGGTWIWNVYGYGATISSAKRGSSAGGATLTVAGANASVGYRRYA